MTDEKPAGGEGTEQAQGPDAAPEAPGQAPASATAGSGPGELIEALEDVDDEEDAPAKPRRFTDSYGLVLVLLIISYFASAAIGDYQWGKVVSVILLAATTWLALRASDVQRRPMRYAQALIPLLCVVSVVTLLTGDPQVSGAVAGSISIVLVVIAPIAIVGRLARHMVISIDTFMGAVCVYLLIAQLFATVYALSAIVSGTPFFVQTAHPNNIDYIYFSFVTITTVGYGDFTAASSVGRMFCVMEAIFGQLYLITVVSLVVQNLGARRQREGGLRRKPRT